MAGKRKPTDENAGQFINVFGPPPKRPRRVAQPVTEASRQEARKQWEDRQRKEAGAKAEFLAQRKREEEAERRTTSTTRIGEVLNAVKDAGYKTLHEFLTDLMVTKDQHQSSQVSQMLINHGHELLDLIRARQPELVSEWITRVAGEILKDEGAKLAQHLRPPQGQGVSTTLANFSLERILADAEYIAPTLCFLLRSLAREDGEDGTQKDKRGNIDLVVTTVICMLSQTRNEKSSEYQTTMSFYLLACGATRSQFEVLNHAGICLSYRSTLRKVKDLGQERLAAVRKTAHERMFMLIWDNLNFAFRVVQQRLGSNDHFDNGTTATLVVLWGVVAGDLPLDILPPRKTRLPVLDFTADDLLPSLKDVQELEALHHWHIEDILVEAYPVLRTRFADSISKPPSILLIPVHVTEHATLPAMEIDESSMDGTIDLFSTIFRGSLKMTEDDIKRHGVVICAGDQLSASLFDKVAASRRNDIDLLDNLGRYGKEQLGIFHAKVAGTRMTVNEHWGTPNSKALWSLWKMNSLLGRKAITAGWKSKKLPPFRPAYELMIDLILPANILDGFRIFCPCDTVEEWVESVPDWQSIRDLAVKVHQQLCSAHQVSKLRRQPATKRDPIYENINLFNRDALTLLALRSAIKRGDIGGVLCSMHPKLRHAYLMNWLANLSGTLLGFKEMDLLQEHQNFWLKVIYNAKGSNRSWQWLGMISVSIFALRDVIRRVQLDYKIPHNGKSHTNPSKIEDIRVVRDYLELHKLQSVCPERADNDLVVPARDLRETGAAYANTARAFKMFRPDTRKAANLGTANGSARADEEVDDEEVANPDNYGQDIDLDLGDLALDEEEFPAGIEPSDFVAMATEAIMAMEQLDL
ncbi:hypothetical protein B0H14DRAFT_3579250 [Mycena olivaceomarginata]|nr:hypothetical protein B0H14DRAFT_3579250 [Mycena olivaceomarginata]